MTTSELTAPHALPAGYRFNEFEILEVIGGGGFGLVYCAWDHQLERTIAIKEYLPVSLAERNEAMNVEVRGERWQKLFSAGLNSFMQEARLLARFNHPGLLHVLRFWEQNGTAYMGTVYYSGMTLKAWLEQRREMIDEAWIRRLLPPLFGAIATLHRAGYLHRDISLDNIQVQDNQLPVLLDFGSARKAIGNLSDQTDIILKPGFAPIEQYSEEQDNRQGPWTDIYALGAVLHTLVTGEPPSASVVRCIEDNYQPLATRRPAGFSPPLLRAIDQALAMQPDRRPASIEAFAALLALPVGEAAAGETLEVGAIVTRQSAAPARRRPAAAQPLPSAALPGEGLRPRTLVLGGVALLALLAMGFGLWRAISPSAVAPVASVPLAGQPAAGGPTLATVYLRLSHGERLRLNGEAIAVTPNDNGYAVLNLAAGDYQLEVQGGSQRLTQRLQVDSPGTWLIALPR
ncbi:serine/threonine-protein kinase [Pantoea sp. 1.19]|uniref:serine/threonine protein kinase n=1 Tax=Pantoea sp. 1.19 TaxID=1925589 RepID=UPI000948F20F|nr:serine/threonine-protein kinase [Pantoea sp. 1.19]